MRISSIELHAACQVSTPLLDACAREGIPVLLATPGQAPLFIIGQQAEARRHRALAAHHGAWTGLDEARRARIAARLIDAKLAACALLVRQRYSASDHHLMAQIQRARAALGRTARIGAFERRQHRGQTQDPVNLALNYGYALLRHRVGTVVRLAGLDPYLGILHEANGRHDALVSDLMEPYRPSIDRLVLRLISLNVLQAKSFVEEDGALLIATDARMRIVQSFTRMLDATPRHGGLALHAHLRRSVESYRDATQESALADWTPNLLSARPESADDFVADGDGRSPEVFDGEESDAIP